MDTCVLPATGVEALHGIVTTAARRGAERLGLPSGITAQPLPVGGSDPGIDPPRTELSITPAAGILLQSVRPTIATTTFTYVCDRPIATYLATYLATATFGDYEVITTVSNGITYRTAVAQSLFNQGTDGTDARAALALSPSIVDYLSALFGAYPFTESGGIAVDVPDLGFALENQTRPIYPGVPDESTIVHELAHQWFGYDVAISRWSDIWLNEGFATYAEWKYSEDHGGDTAQQFFDGLYAMAVHALRTEVGLTALFDTWIHSTVKP